MGWREARSGRLLLTVCIALSPSCGQEPEVARRPPTAVAPAQPTPARPAAPAAEAAPLVVFLGDSLTAGLGLAAEDAFPAQLGRMLAADGVAVRLVNAGVSGDTTAGGLARLDWVLAQEPDVLVVELGANDGLRGLSLAETESNLRAILTAARRAAVPALLIGMKLPPNYGPAYTRGFEEIFPRLARELDVALVPFLLAGVAGRPELNQPDGIHPTAEGHRIMAATVRPQLERLLPEQARR